MLVGELVKLLDDYGDHLEVVIEDDETGFYYTPSIGTSTIEGFPVLVFLPDDQRTHG